MDHHVLEQILGLLHEFGVQADAPCPAVAAAPLGLHALEVIGGYLDAYLRLPAPDKLGDTPEYDRVIITYNASNHNSIGEALEDLFFALTSQLSLTYAIHAADARAVFRWDALSAQVDALVGAGTVSRTQRIKRALLRGRALSKIHQTLAEFEASALEDEHYIKRARKQLFRGEQALSLQALVDAAIDDREYYPVAQVEKLVTHIEAKHAHRVELLVVILASLIGGIVGSLVTMLASGPSLSH